MRGRHVFAVAVALVGGAAGLGCGNSSGVAETGDNGAERAQSTASTTSPAVCDELRSELEVAVEELGGITEALGPIEEGDETGVVLQPFGATADWEAPVDPPIEFLLQSEYRYVLEMETGWLYASTSEEVNRPYRALVDEGCDLGWFADLTQPVRDSYVELIGATYIIEPLPEW